MDLIFCVVFALCALGPTLGEITTKPHLCTDDKSQCYKPDSNQICSERGTCVCGLCQCSSRRGDLPLTYTGRWCECDDSSCPFHNGALCGGSDHGVCDCGFCKCFKNFTGKNCGCSTKVDMCQSSDGSLCGGHGTCKCNQCVCKAGYTGPQCTECKGCTECDANQDCVECLVSNTGKYKDRCTEHCGKLNINLVDDVDLEDDGDAEDADDEEYCEYNGIKFTVHNDDKMGLQIKASRIQDDDPGNNGCKLTISLSTALITILTRVFLR